MADLPVIRAVLSRAGADLDEADFAQRVDAAIGEFDGLLDEEAVAWLVLDEMGLNEGAYVTLDGLAERAEATVRVSIERVDPPRSLGRKSGDDKRFVNVHVSDATGSARIVLWDRDAEQAEDGTLRAGQHVTLVNARVRPGDDGVAELHVTRWSVLEIEGALDPARRKLLADIDEAAVRPERPDVDAVPREVSGRLVWSSGVRPVKRPRGPVTFAQDIDLEGDDGQLRRVVLWDDAIKGVRMLPACAHILLDALTPKLRGARVEWHTSDDSSIAAR